MTAKQRVLIWLMLNCVPVPMLAQTININSINTAGFPTITAEYSAYDAAGNLITDTRSTDFRLTERVSGGAPIDHTATLFTECRDVTNAQGSSIIIILDRSLSMGENVNGRSRFEYAKDAIRSYLNNLSFAGDTRVTLLTFSGQVDCPVKWATSAQPILDSLVNMKVLTNTNYVAPFEDPIINIYDLFLQRPSNLPKSVVFLTDGHPNPGIEVTSKSKSESQFVTDNTALLLAQGIQFNSVTMLEPTTHWVLEAFAKNTGGKSIVTTEDRVVDIFTLLARETATRKVCTLRWVAPYACSTSELSRTISVTLLRGANPTTTSAYVAPVGGIARIIASDTTVTIGNPSPGQSSFAQIVVTAQGTSLAVSGHAIDAPQMFSVVDWNYPQNQTAFSPFTLAPGSSRTLRIRFTQGATATPRRGQLVLTATPCESRITLKAGVGVLEVQSPKAGEQYSMCDTVRVVWNGVSLSRPVRLEYSTDGGPQWRLIKDSVTGSGYPWLPPAPSSRYQVRARTSAVTVYDWATQIGDAANDTVTSIDVNPYGSKVFVTGVVSQSGASGNTDGFFVELGPDGTISSSQKVMRLSGSDANEERVVGCVTDAGGNTYVAGYFSSPTALFGPFVMSRGPRDTRNFFVYKFDATGALSWITVSKGTTIVPSDADVSDIGIRYDAAGSPEVVVRGRFRRYVEVGLNRSGVLEKSQTYADAIARDFHVIFDEAGYPRFVLGALGVPGEKSPSGFRLNALDARDTLGAVYAAGTFTGSRTFAPFTVNSGGGSDVFVTKQVTLPAAAAVMPGSFTVVEPAITAGVNTIIFPLTELGETAEQNVDNALRNLGTVNVVIDSLTITGSNASQFQIIAPRVGDTLRVGAAKTVAVRYQPTVNGVLTAQLNVRSRCGNTVVIRLQGESRSNPFVIIPLQGVVSICENDSTRIGVRTVGGRSPFTLTWRSGGSVVSVDSSFTVVGVRNDTLICIACDADGKCDTAQVVVDVKPLPQVQIAERPVGTLAATTDATLAGYQWYTVDTTAWTPILGATAASFTPAVSGTYGVDVVNLSSTCRSRSAPFPFTLRPPPPVLVVTPVASVLDVCSGRAVQFAVRIEGGSRPYQIRWFEGDSLIDQDDTLITHTPRSSTIICLVTDGNGSIDTASITVRITSTPQAGIQEAPQGTLVAIPSDADSFQWLDGNKNSLDGANQATYSPTVSGSYFVVVATKGCADTSDAFDLQLPQPRLIVDDYDFGTLPVDDLINSAGGHVGSVRVRNATGGYLELTGAVTTDPTAFIVPQQWPRRMQDGDTTEIAVRFLPTEKREYRSDITCMTSTGDAGTGRLRGTGRDLLPGERVTQVVLSPSRREVDPGDTISVVVFISAERPTVSAGQPGLFSTTIQWDSRVLEPISTPAMRYDTTGTYGLATVTNGYRQPNQTQIYRFRFVAKQAEVDTTTIIFSGAAGFVWQDDRKAFPALVDSVVRIRVCRDGGPQLVGRRSLSRLVHIHPTPASTAVEITTETVEPCTLDILTSEGESVFSRGINVGSSTVKVNVDYLQPGIYGCRLRTERGVLQVVPFIIVR